MSRSEFRWNKKRKHYAYLFKDKGEYRKNILLHSDPEEKDNWKKFSNKDKTVFYKKNTRLYRHPNPSKPPNKKYYVENRVYIDNVKSFDNRTYNWKWHKNDKRKIKRIKKGRRTR